MSDFKVITPKRDIARELARRYSTMTHDELDVLESILEPIKYGKGEKILVEGEKVIIRDIMGEETSIEGKILMVDLANSIVKLQCD